MSDLRRLSNADFAREAERRGMEVRHKPVALTDAESRCIRLLVLAAELCQEGLPRTALGITAEAECYAWACYKDGAVDRWLWKFCGSCHNSISWKNGSGPSA